MLVLRVVVVERRHADGLRSGVQEAVGSARIPRRIETGGQDGPVDVQVSRPTMTIIRTILTPERIIGGVPRRASQGHRKRSGIGPLINVNNPITGGTHASAVVHGYPDIPSDFHGVGGVAALVHGVAGRPRDLDARALRRRRPGRPREDDAEQRRPRCGGRILDTCLVRSPALRSYPVSGGPPIKKPPPPPNATAAGTGDRQEGRQQELRDDGQLGRRRVCDARGG